MPEDGTKGLGNLADTLRKVPAVPTRMPDVGEVFADRYDIQRLLGRGGMGIVFLANQSPLRRQVAIKILKPPESLDDDPNFDERFLREAEAAARLQHPNTITVHDFGQADDGVLYIVMEYLEGNDLRTVLAHERTFSPARAIHIAKQVCKSLREAHRKGVIHRDLKPANVLLVRRDEDDDFVKVLDFGLVKFRGEASEITLAGKFLGSPRYTSPEALDRTRDVDHRADIYALGVLLFTMITGRPPFDGDPMQVLHAHLHETPKTMRTFEPSSQTTPELEALVARCLEKNPDDRYQSMGDLIEALRSAGAAFGQQDTETVDFDVNESLELDPEPSSIPTPRPEKAKAKASRSRSKVRPVARTRREPAPTTGSTTAITPPRKQRRRRSRGPVTGLAAFVCLLIAALFFLFTRGTDEPPGASGLSTDQLGAAQPNEIEVAGVQTLSIQVDVQPPGAEVQVGFDGVWSSLGVAPIQRPNYVTPENFNVVALRISHDGFETTEVVTSPVLGVLSWTGKLSELRKPVPRTPQSPPPVSAPRATPKPTPKANPNQETTPKDGVPSGYKDNPY